MLEQAAATQHCDPTALFVQLVHLLVIPSWNARGVPAVAVSRKGVPSSRVPLMLTITMSPVLHMHTSHVIVKVI